MSGPRERALPLLVRPELPADHAAVYEINRRAFERESEARLVEALRRTADPQISLVAVRDGYVVGHVFFSPVTIDGETGRPAALGLAPLAVAPECQRQGIGSALVRAGLDAARRAGHGVVVVFGHPGFYPRFGFRPAIEQGLRYEASVPDDDRFMAVELEPGALRRTSGVVRYLPEFALVERDP